MSKQIISCSRRTDIPAFYYDWLQEALKNKTIKVPNVMFPENVYTYDLSPENIRCIVLWSKDFTNVVKNPGYLDEYNLIFNYTINGYNKILEPNVPEYVSSIKTVENMLKKYRPQQIRPRFDPIILSTMGEHTPTIDKVGKARLIQFERMCKELNSLGIDNITYSFIDLYGHVVKKLNNIQFKHLELNDDLKIKFSERMVEIADKYNVKLYSCATPLLETVEGVNKSHCIDGNLIEELFPQKDKVSKAKDPGQKKRLGCGCMKSIDIGGYLPCKHSCVYCYGITQ